MLNGPRRGKEYMRQTRSSEAQIRVAWSGSYLSCPLKGSLDTVERSSGRQLSWWEPANVQLDLNLHISQMVDIPFQRIPDIAYQAKRDIYAVLFALSMWIGRPEQTVQTQIRRRRTRRLIRGLHDLPLIQQRYMDTQHVEQKSLTFPKGYFCFRSFYCVHSVSEEYRDQTWFFMH